MGLLLLILLIMVLVGTVPAWPHSREWGYTPSGIFGFLLVVLVVLLLFNAVPWGWGPTPVP
jgi:hypothetical protein